MSNIIIKTQLRKKTAHIFGLEGVIILLLQQNPSGMQRIPTFVSKNKSDRVSKSIEKLRQRHIYICGNKTKLFKYINYVRGKVYYEFSNAATHLLNKPGYYTIDLLIYLSFRSKFQRALYELVCQFKGTKRINKLLDSLKERMGVTSKDYNKFGRFKRLVLKPAIENVSSITGVTFKLQGDTLFKTESTESGKRIKIYFEHAKMPAYRPVGHKMDTYTRLVKRYGVPCHTALRAVVGLPEQFINDLLKEAQYRPSDAVNPVKNRKKYIISILHAALNPNKRQHKKKKCIEASLKKPSPVGRKHSPPPHPRKITYKSPPPIVYFNEHKGPESFGEILSSMRNN